ncbi:retrovirus-related pol polyprotein from transposon TNT 1-94 [Tanacetum coccineum]
MVDVGKLSSNARTFFDSHRRPLPTKRPAMCNKVACIPCAYFHGLSLLHDKSRMCTNDDMFETISAFDNKNLCYLETEYKLRRQPANTKISNNKTVRRVRVCGGNVKWRALRLDTVNAAPYKKWYLQHYDKDLGCKKKAVTGAIKKRCEISNKLGESSSEEGSDMEGRCLDYVGVKRVFIIQIKKNLIDRISSLSIGSSNVRTSESPYLLVLITGTSQSRQHDKSESDLTSHLPQCYLMLKLEGFPFVTMNAKEHHSECFGKITWIMRRTLYISLVFTVLVPSCCVIFDLEPLSLSFDFVFTSEIFKSLSFSLDRLCHLTILYLDQHAHTLHHLESLLIISLDRLKILKEDLVYQSLRKSLSLILELS